MPWHDFWVGGFWIFPILMMLVMLVCLFVFGRVFLGRYGRPICFFDRERKSHESVESPLDIAKRRFARGEISKEEFEEIKKTIV